MKVKRETELHPGHERDEENERKEGAMKLPPSIEFHEDIRLLVYRPRGLVNEAAINKVLTALEDLEAKLQEPFNRFTDTVAADEIELNFEYVIKFSLHRRLSYAGHPPVKSAILATDAAMIHYGRLHAVLTQRFADHGPHFSRSTGSCAMARRSDRTANCGHRWSST